MFFSMKKSFLSFLFSWAMIAVASGQSLPTLIPYLDGHKWGYADTNGNIIITPQWRHVNFFKDGRAHVYTKNSHCIIDTNGAYIIPPYRNWNGKFYTSVIGAYYNATGKNGKYGIIDSNNKELLPCQYDKTEHGNGFTSSGFFKWSEPQKKYVGKVCKNGKYGLVDTLNNILIPFKYDGINIDRYPFSSDKYYVVQVKGKMGVIDAHNRTIIKPKYENIWLDDKNPNQIKLFTKTTSMIADSNGKITLKIPGYAVEFPYDSLIRVSNSEGKQGLMNYKHELVIPCIYLGVWLQHDTIVVSQHFLDSTNHKVQYFKYYDRHTLQEISGWLIYQQFMRLPAPVREASIVLNNKLPHYTKLRIQGNNLNEYKKDNILWGALDVPKMPEYLMPVRGISMKDSTVFYAAVIDTNGNYVVGPQRTNNELRVVNAADSLITIQTKDRDSFQAVANFQLKPILPFQKYAIEAAFYYNDTFFAIAKYDHSRWVSWSHFEGGGSAEVHDYTYFLVAKDGKPAKGMEDYKLHWFTDSTGYRVDEDRYAANSKDGFNASFKGCFMAEDSIGKKGIVTIHGHVLLPALSFRYYQLNPKGPNVFLVDNQKPRQMVHSVLFDISMRNSKNERILWKDFPYLVDSNNNVLLDSLSVERIWNVSEQGHSPLYGVYLKTSIVYDSGHEDVFFYMNDQGKGYYRNLPGDKSEASK